ncbi:hypothetical protein HAP48_0028995 [Bradyrhizobium septentrionale]|uniref:alpha/beta fold hydrolase n=1 Tax=Bradyrhizobium septentrionale TaxID=1404411 RepID=UPI001F317D02|nr:hypothetical protein [Bradyrhizobium septentrionale]UGY20676.1 hypothetical protein HAP48_0028995 [Bradyrhizobium septentrionale]
MVDALADRFRVVCVDSLGHGLSDKPADPALYNQAQRAGDIVAVIDDSAASAPMWWDIRWAAGSRSASPDSSRRGWRRFRSAAGIFSPDCRAAMPAR